MNSRLPISLVSALALGQFASALVADPSITAAPELKRQNNDRFIGFVESDGTWYTESCNSGLTWFQDGKYAQCCPTSLASCYAPTACSQGSIVYPYSDISSTTTIACTDNFNNPSFSICNTAFIFENFEDSEPQTDIVCGPSSQNWSYYRKIPATATEPRTSSPDDTTTTTPTTSSSSSSSSSATPPPNSGGGGSKAWIAGAVVGPLIGIALIAGVVFFLMKKKKKEDKTHGAGAAALPPTAQYSDAKPTAFVAPQGSFTPHDPYNQQQGYPQQPMSPAPQYSAPYDPAQSPPPAGVYAQDVKPAQYPPAAPHPEAAELGGGSSTSAAPPATGGNAFTAELDGQQSPRK